MARCPSPKHLLCKALLMHAGEEHMEVTKFNLTQIVLLCRGSEVLREVAWVVFDEVKHLLFFIYKQTYMPFGGKRA